MSGACTLSAGSEIWAFVAALVVVVIYLGISGIIARGNPLTLVMGADGRPSTSKFQFFLWTGVVLFTYVLIYGGRVACGNYAAIDTIPHNVLIAMGFSVVTLAAAKGITVSYKSTGRVDKTPSTQGGIFSDDSGQPDLTKIQMVMWTLIAAVAYLIQVIANLNGFATCSAGATCPFPDIDASLMVLMGLGQGAYLGNKLTTADSVPTLKSLSKPTAKVGESIDIVGDGFGDAQRGSQITMDGSPLTEPASPWTATKITFNVPAQHPKGAAWQLPQTVQVGVIVDGDASRQTLPLGITA